MIYSKKRSCREITHSRFAPFICLIALIFQVTLPAMHTWQVAIEQTAVSSQMPARADVFATDQKGVWRSTPRAIPSHPSHDPALCPVCEAFSHVREGALTQISTLDVPTTHAGIALSLLLLRGDHFYPAASPRAPPYSA